MQIEILLKQKQEQNSGFRRAAWARAGAALASACALCRAVAHLAIAMCSTRALTRTLIATDCARSYRSLNNMCAGLHIKDTPFCANSCMLGTVLDAKNVNITKVLQKY